MKTEICLTQSFECEKVSSKPSITVAAEKLDLADMIKRASMGILDLNSYKTQLAADLTGITNQKDYEKAANSLLERPASALDRVFGTDRETATLEMQELYKVAERNRKPKAATAPDPATPPQAKEPEPAKEPPTDSPAN